MRDFPYLKRWERRVEGEGRGEGRGENEYVGMEERERKE